MLRSPRVVLLAVPLVLAGLAGCGDEPGPTPPTRTTAHAIEGAPFTFTVAERKVTIDVDDDEVLSTSDEPITVVCANLHEDGFTNKLSGSGVWKARTSSYVATLPESVADRDLCALSLTARDKRQAIAFFDPAAEETYTSAK